MVKEYGPENKHLQQQAQMMGIYNHNGYGLQCRAVTLIKGKVYQCDLRAAHHGWAHQNFELESLWKDAD